MRIAVITAAVPFAPSPVRRLAAELASALDQLGHAALVLNLPLPEGPLPVEHVLAIRALRLPNVDRVIALGFPACVVRHTQKVAWLAVDDMCGAYGCYLRESHAVYAASPRGALPVMAGVLSPPDAGASWRCVAEILTA